MHELVQLKTGLKHIGFISSLRKGTKAGESIKLNLHVGMFSAPNFFREYKVNTFI